MAQSLICLGSYHVGHVGIAMAEQIIRDRPVLHTADSRPYLAVSGGIETEKAGADYVATQCASKRLRLLHYLGTPRC